MLICVVQIAPPPMMRLLVTRRISRPRPPAGGRYGLPGGAEPIGDLMQYAVAESGWSTDALRCSVGEIKAAASTFSRHTAYGVEGMHPRQIGWLSDEALECIAEVFDIFSASGVLPRQLMTMTNPPDPEAVGGGGGAGRSESMVPTSESGSAPPSGRRSRGWSPTPQSTRNLRRRLSAQRWTRCGAPPRLRKQRRKRTAVPDTAASPAPRCSST